MRGVIEQHFGESSRHSIGLEEELMLLDAATFAPVAAVDVFVRGAAERDLPGIFKTELHASVVELATGICVGVEDAVAALRELRAAADEIARANGLRVAAAGSHPTAPIESLPIVAEERYASLVRELGYVIRRQGVNGLHVHVGVASTEECYERLEAVLPWLPVVLALSANSPFVSGTATGMLSNRVAVLAELPRSGAPPAFGSYAAWETWVERFVDLGVMEDYTRVWWDIRPHPRLGTLEVRMPDQPTALERTALIARLVRALVESAPAREPTNRGDYAQNRWSAAHGGMDAQLLHPDGDRRVVARDLARQVLGREPPDPEALQQLDVGPLGAAADLVERTLG
jgi:carboxylate-amine ligase